MGRAACRSSCGSGSAREVVEVANDPAISQTIASSGQDVRTGGPAEMAQTLKQQAQRAAEIAKILGMTAKN